MEVRISAMTAARWARRGFCTAKTENGVYQWWKREMGASKCRGWIIFDAPFPRAEIQQRFDHGKNFRYAVMGEWRWMTGNRWSG